MAEAIIKDKKRIITCSAYLDGEYGVKGCFVGVPVKLGRDGIEEIIELELTVSEKEQFQASVSEVQKLIRKLKI